MGVKHIKKIEKNTPLTLLIILDGFGLADTKRAGNAITAKTAPHIFRYMRRYPSTMLVAHGAAVGLFPKQEGNSEAGHFNIGAGRIVEQDLVRIERAIDDGTFFKNTAFHEALFHVNKYHTAVHVAGLLTNGQSAHAHPEHLYALLEYFRREAQKKVYLHIFTDGRDSSPHSAIHHLKELRAHMRPNEQIATVTGRFYAMDRNKIWERTEQTYGAMVGGEGAYTADCAEDAIAHAYNRGETDEYICPTVILNKGEPVSTVRDNDAVFLFNARSDRARQLTKAFVQDNFQKENPGAFKRQSVPRNIRFVAMTDFGPDLPGVLTAFPHPEIHNALAKAIGDRYRQLFISETEKYAHITYFLNGGHAKPINGEVRELVASGNHYSYADNPGMHAREVTSKIIGYLKNNMYDFICVNFPSADMVGHTGDFSAAKKAVSCVDTQVARLCDAILKKGGQALIVADHGNAEDMLNPTTGEIRTEHSTNPVPCILVCANHAGMRLKKGRLCDVAPTLLKLMGIEKPKEMTGRSLCSVL